ncbi:RNA polymerase sigma factor [Fulvivirga sediminis]|uniref:Sigma-70 family RNA polymerase sigma factor n=1 Tax=Fulvivirga sediminis TaxID=2803949 RepID=A0A937JZR9_9BACT|nr:sigma-70 family RNA polymerase sigma factor [Fulvivirga sediminis]MBL3654717.1 sigma-70 family RNA polymerase sigma factor [Fulvivirga sediminis]
MIKTITLNSLNKARHMTEEDITHEQRVIEASKKDAKAFGAIYDQYYEGIFNFIYRRTDDEDLTADICSQTFLKALQNLKKYEFRGLPFSAWLYRIASNEVNKHFNKNKRNKIFSVEEERVLELFEQHENDFSEDQIRLLIATLRELPTETMEVLELRFFEDRSFKEIAFILNIGESGAKMRLYRAVEKLKKHFKVNWEQ